VFLHGIDPTVPNANDGFTERLPYEFVAGLRDDAGGVLQLESVPVAVKLPVATPPDGVPKLASAGYALSKYEPLDHYSHTLPRQRQLWLECAESPAPGDGLFARVLAYAPDPLLYTDAQLELTPPGEDPPLKLDPELMRVITHGQPTDSDGLEAMVELTASADDPKTFLLPLPEGVDEHDPRLFGMWTYELRFGHTKPWSLAHARFGRPLRVTGIQHPAPELPCVASWERRESLTDNEAARRGIAVHTRFQLVASAPYATPVTEDGRRVGSGFPHTTIGFLLYAQAIQADGSGYRNVLIAHAGATPVRPRETQDGFVYDYGSAIFVQTEIEAVLYDHGLPLHAPLSVVAVEFYAPGGSIRGDREAFFSERAVNAARAGAADDPFGPESFGKRRILRTSPLVKVEPYC
jgi:hypothetical protein